MDRTAANVQIQGMIESYLFLYKTDHISTIDVVSSCFKPNSNMFLLFQMDIEFILLFPDCKLCKCVESLSVTRKRLTLLVWFYDAVFSGLEFSI